ncbi:hypothetical protein ACLMJK_009431 [Lecanora helva]
MALVLGDTTALEPEVKLTFALRDYESILSDADRSKLHSQGPPDATAAVNLATQIDRDCSSRRSRCMGPRLITFLESIQQFSQVVETFVSSHPEVAALASKAVLIPFKTEFGPYEAEIAHLSQEVRDEVSLASKQAQRQEFELQAKERADARRYRDIYYKSKHKEENWRLEISHRKLEKKKLEALDALSTYDYQKTYRQLRKECTPGTSTWIYKEPEFCAWVSGTLRTLWFTGKLGSGKSVASACVAAQQIESNSTHNATAFFFCRFDESESLKAETIIGCIARQLVSNLPANAFRAFNQKGTQGSSIISFLEAVLNHNWQYSIILDGLDECNKSQLNEVADVIHKMLLSPCLRIKLFWSSRPSTLSSLPGKFLTQGHIDLETVENQRKVAYNIHQFIHITLEEWLKGETPELQINNPSLIVTVLDCLKEGAQGMFLWVKFQLQTLREKRSDSHILAALRDLPQDLPETFNRILSQYTKADDVELGKQIFHWVSVAKRPLTLEELREAIGTKPLQDVWNDSTYINDMKKAVATCGHLVFIEEEQQTVQFTHGSVRQYLLSEATQASLSKYHIDLQKADEHVGAVCVTYLNFSVFNRQLAHTSKKSISTTGVTSTIVKNSLPRGNQIALRLLRRYDKPGKPVHRLLEEAIGNTEARRQSNIVRQYPFRFYANQFWLEHTKQGISPDSDKLWELWCNLIREANWRDTLSSIPWTIEDWMMGATNVIQWIVEQNHCSLARLITISRVQLTQHTLIALIQGAATNGYANLMDISLGLKPISQPILDSAFQAAAAHGHLDTVERLLQAKADVNAAAVEFYGRTALQAAAGGGYLDTVERLLQAGADINAGAAGNNGRTTLQAAAGGGYLDTVERLLQAGADINAAAAGNNGRTTLQAAAGGGHLAVVERLLQAKADINDATAIDNGRTALQAAAEGGHLDVVERLLQARADVNATATYYNGRTALQAAAGCGYLDVVERLLQARADVNAAAARVNGRTALQAAAGCGYLAIVERLLQAKADVNAAAAGDNGRTALQAAAGGGHLDTVERLLQAKANVNAAAVRYNGRTALQAAAEGGHLAVVERLLQAGADVNAAAAAGSNGRTALQAAAGGGHLAVVERLLQAGADVNAAAAAGSNGRTALQAAAGGGHLAVVERLLQAGADVNAAAAAGSNGRTALQAAAGGGHLDIVERLLQAGADVNAAAAAGSNGRTALQAAAGGGHLAVVERLLQAGADVNAAAAAGSNGRTALQAAAGGGHLAVVERLLQAGADVNAAAAARVNGRTALQAAAEGGYLDVVERLLQAKADVNAAAAGDNGRTALQAAAEGGYLDVVERLLQAKADVNAAAVYHNGRTAIQAAAGGGHLNVVERLLQAKADVNATAAYHNGRTAIQAAAGGGHLNVVERLLQAKADVNATAAYHNGRTAIQAAAGGGHLNVVERLLQAKADVNATAAYHNGRTAIQAAAGGGHLNVVERLLQAKADVNATAAYHNGRTAIQAAAGGGHLAVLKRLRAVGAE